MVRRWLHKSPTSPTLDANVKRMLPLGNLLDHKLPPSCKYTHSRQVPNSRSRDHDDAEQNDRYNCFQNVCVCVFLCCCVAGLGGGRMNKNSWSLDDEAVGVASRRVARNHCTLSVIDRVQKLSVGQLHDIIIFIYIDPLYIDYIDPLSRLILT